MTALKMTLVLPLVGAMAACTQVGEDKSVDRGIGNGPLDNLQAGIWVDPNGCDHWIIDDGVEGYLSQRLDPRGKPVCSGIAPPTTVVGNFKGGQDIGDGI